MIGRRRRTKAPPGLNLNKLSINVSNENTVEDSLMTEITDLSISGNQLPNLASGIYEITDGDKEFSSHWYHVRRGKKRANLEDVCSVYPNLLSSEGSKFSFFAVYDGHGGVAAAEFAHVKLVENLLSNKNLDQGNFHQALIDAFLKTDAQILDEDDKSSNNMPNLASPPPVPINFNNRSTLPKLYNNIQSNTLNLLSPRNNNNNLVTPRESNNRRPRSAIPFPHTNQTPNDYEGNYQRQYNLRSSVPFLARESKKLHTKINGQCGTTAVTALVKGKKVWIAHVGDSRAVLCRGRKAIALSSDHIPMREDELKRIEGSGGVVLMASSTYRVNGVLAVSRAIGDKDLKRYIIAEPEIFEFLLDQQDEFLILASDGLWGTVDNQTAVDIAYKHMDYPDQACKSLVDYAVEKGSTDDIGIIFLRLPFFMDKSAEEEPQG